MRALRAAGTVIDVEDFRMGRSDRWMAGAAAALAVTSFGAPAVAETVEIICDVERRFEANGRPGDNRFASQWRFSVDTGTPSVSLIAIDGDTGGTPPGEAWLIGTPAPTGRAADGSIIACLIQSGRCGETVRFASFEQDTQALRLWPDLSFMSLVSTSLSSTGRTSLFDWRGPCRRG